MRKGSLVRLNLDICFTSKNGGKLQFPLSNSYNDDRGIVEGFYKLTQEQREALRKVTYYRGLDDAGESRLVPSEGTAILKKNSVYPVLRARARTVYNYRSVGGLAVILDTKTGKEVYIKRKYLEEV